MRPNPHIPPPSAAAVFLAILLFTSAVTSQIQGAPQLGDSPEVIGATPSESPNAAPTDNANGGNNNNNNDNNQQPADQPNNGAQANPQPAADTPDQNQQPQQPEQQPQPTSAAGISGPVFTDAPTLQGVGIPPLVVPDTSGAPFMQKSDLPQGTVFIAVGATLGFLAASVLAWRGLVAWSVSRSVRRAARYQYPTESKSLFGSSAPGYSSMYDASNVSMDHLATANTAYTGAGSNRQSTAKNAPKSRRSSKNPANANLFFSPTAGVGADLHSQRGSAYLPAGYYAAGSSVPGAASGNTQPAGSGYGRLSSVGHSPPDSPGVPPARRSRASPYASAYGSRPQSREHVDFQAPTERRSRMAGHGENNLSVGNTPQGRTPSTYLDDLFENHGSGMGRE